MEPEFVFEVNNIVEVIERNIEICDTLKILKMINQRPNRCSFIAFHNNFKKKYFVKIKASHIVNDAEIMIHSILKKIKSPLLVNVINYFKSDDLYVFIYEYFDGVDLKNAIDTKMIKQSEIESVCHKVIDMIKLLHSHDIVHCDIKPENILINKNGSLKLTDFESALMCHTDELINLHSPIGTVGFMSPECFDINIYSKKSDFWSLGVTLYYILTGKLPYAHTIDHDIHMNIRNNYKYLNMTRIGNNPLKNTIANLLVFDHDERFLS